MTSNGAYKQIEQLYNQLSQLSPDEIIERLEQIRSEREFIPWYPLDLNLYRIYDFLSRSEDLTKKHARKMSRMLFWNEYAVRQCHGSILYAMERFPQPDFRGLLIKYILQIEENLDKARWGSSDFANLSSNRKWASRVRAKC